MKQAVQTPKQTFWPSWSRAQVGRENEEPGPWCSPWVAFASALLFGSVGKREQAPLRLYLERVPKAVPTPSLGLGLPGPALRSKMAPIMLGHDWGAKGGPSLTRRCWLLGSPHSANSLGSGVTNRIRPLDSSTPGWDVLHIIFSWRHSFWLLRFGKLIYKKRPPYGLKRRRKKVKMGCGEMGRAQQWAPGFEICCRYENHSLARFLAANRGQWQAVGDVRARPES